MDLVVMHVQIVHTIRCSHGYQVGRLLAEGADPNGAAAGETPAMAAAAAGACDCLELLLAAGAELERAVGAGGTALHCAAAAGQRLTVELLVRAGVAAGGARPDGQTASLLAAEAGRLDITEMLREKQRRRTRRSRGPPPPSRKHGLHAATLHAMPARVTTF